VEEHAAGVDGAAAKGHVLGAVEGEIGTRLLGLELGLLRLSTLFSTLAIHFPLGLSLGEQQQEKHDWMNGGVQNPRRRRQFSSTIPPIDSRHFLLKKIELAQSVFKRAIKNN
jgi:hypothetical protein